MFGLIQIIVAIIVLFAISRAVLRLKDRKISLAAFIFWSFVWTAVLIIALIPGSAEFITGTFGVKRGIDFLVYLSIILLFYLIFRAYVQLGNISQQITKLTRELAIRGGKRKKR